MKTFLMVLDVFLIAFVWGLCIWVMCVFVRWDLGVWTGISEWRSVDRFGWMFFIPMMGLIVGAASVGILRKALGYKG